MTPSWASTPILKSKKQDPATNKTLCSGLNGTDAGLAALKTGKVVHPPDLRLQQQPDRLRGRRADGRLVRAACRSRRSRRAAASRCLSPDGVDDFKALTADPAASYTKLIGGDYDTLGLALWGQIDYDTRMNYTANASPRSRPPGAVACNVIGEPETPRPHYGTGISRPPDEAFGRSRNAVLLPLGSSRFDASEDQTT